MKIPTKASLTPERRCLLELMQRINFGRIEGLQVRRGQPCIDGANAPRVIHEVKFGVENGPRPEASVDDFVLKAQIIELFEFFDRVQDADIAVLIIKHGLPFGLHVEQVA